MSNNILDLFPQLDVIFPQQQTHLVIPQASPFFSTKLQGSTIGICFIKTSSTDKLTSTSNIHDICVSFHIQTESIQTNGPHSQNDFKIVTGTARNRLRIVRFLSSMIPYKVEVQLIDEPFPNDEKNVIIDSSIDNLREMASDYIEIVRQSDVIKRPKQELPECITSVSSLCYTIASQLKVPNGIKYDILRLQCDQERVETLTEVIKIESACQEARDQVRRHAFEVTRKHMREKNLHGELSNIKNKSEFAQDDELDKLRDKLNKSKLPQEVVEITDQEFNRLKQMSPRDSEYGKQKKYLETIADLPWDIASKELNNIAYAEMVLDKDHAGLEKVKTRILEFVAVKILKKNSKGSILCLQGPPGVGKTSLGKSIAEALGRKFERIALGGVSDEAEVRGHRRTYLGAMPGMMIEALLRCKTNNPVVLLDEIDKVGKNKIRGDPSSALLEVLDPNQNNSFKDHYLGVPFDLSNVLFIATANSLETIPAPLLDRMEVISLSGYTAEEKTEIAKHYLIPKQIQENGIQGSHIEFPGSSIRFLIDCYTREAGVRNLERTIGSLCRKVAFQYLKTQQLFISPQMDAIVVQDNNNFEKVVVTEKFIEQELGPSPFDNNVKQDIHEPGIAIGMAWTAEGGKILTVEASLSRGKGRLQLTGQLGDVMKESVLTSLGWIKSNYSLISFLSRDSTNLQTILVDQEEKISSLESQDLNVHFPAAAIPKDGPSAGITVTIALVSILTKRKVMNDVAMTGEISLKGAVLPVGGIKEKCLAAYASGLRRVILPERNKKDILDLPKEVRENMTFHFVKNIIEAIVLAIEPQVETTDRSMNRQQNPKL